MRSGSDYRPINVCARSYDNRRLRHQLPLVRVYKNFRQSLKFGQTLFVVSILVRYYQINQSIGISHLQSPDARYLANRPRVPDPAGGAYDVPPDHYGGKRLAAPPKNFVPVVGRWASIEPPPQTLPPN